MYINPSSALSDTNDTPLSGDGNTHYKPGYRRVDRDTSSPVFHRWDRCPKFPTKTPTKIIPI